MNAANDLHAWVARAEEDYQAARIMLRRRSPLVHSACFHTQQCVEKYLKAVLVAAGQPFPYTHDLAAVNTLCVQAGIDLKLDIRDLTSLSTYAVRARYPGIEPTESDARNAVALTARIRRRARRQLGL